MNLDEALQRHLMRLNEGLGLGRRNGHQRRRLRHRVLRVNLRLLDDGRLCGVLLHIGHGRIHLLELNQFLLQCLDQVPGELLRRLEALVAQVFYVEVNRFGRLDAHHGIDKERAASTQRGHGARLRPDVVEIRTTGTDETAAQVESVRCVVQSNENFLDTSGTGRASASRSVGHGNRIGDDCGLGCGQCKWRTVRWTEFTAPKRARHVHLDDFFYPLHGHWKKKDRL